MRDCLWPLRGVLRFLASPTWWLRPALSMVAAGAALGLIGVAVLWWRWPPSSVTGWHAWLAGAMAIGQAAAAILCAWLALAPLLVAWAMDALVLDVHHRAGVAHRPLPGVWAGMLASGRVMAGTLVPRLGGGVGGVVVSLCAGPAGAVIAAIGMAYVACLDAIDAALAARGLDGAQRLQALRNHRFEVLMASLVAGVLNLALAATVVLWIVWLPGLVVGAAQLVLGWSECAAEPPTSAGHGPPAAAGPRPPER